MYSRGYSVCAQRLISLFTGWLHLAPVQLLRGQQCGSCIGSSQVCNMSQGTSGKEQRCLVVFPWMNKCWIKKGPQLVISDKHLQLSRLLCSCQWAFTQWRQACCQWQDTVICLYAPFYIPALQQAHTKHEDGMGAICTTALLTHFHLKKKCSRI